MKALTILQPYAAMIALPDDDWLAKRVENRTWWTDYRGVLAIHAGTSKSLLRVSVDNPSLEVCTLPFASMAFGAIIATARLTGCYNVLDQMNLKSVLRQYPWMENNPHVEGPICWILQEVHILSMPIRCKGAQGLWTVPSEIAERLKQERTRAGY